MLLFSDITSILKKTPDEDGLLFQLFHIRHNWYDIGLSLQVRRNVLDDLKQSEDNRQTRLRKVINIWKDTKSSSVTWETVITAMESPIINNKRIADYIRQHLRLGRLLLLSNVVILLILSCQETV